MYTVSEDHTGELYEHKERNQAGNWVEVERECPPSNSLSHCSMSAAVSSTATACHIAACLPQSHLQQQPVTLQHQPVTLSVTLQHVCRSLIYSNSLSHCSMSAAVSSTATACHIAACLPQSHLQQQPVTLQHVCRSLIYSNSLSHCSMSAAVSSTATACHIAACLPQSHLQQQPGLSLFRNLNS